MTEGRREDKTVDAKKEEEMNDGRVRLKRESFNDSVTFLLEADVTSYCMCLLARGGQG